MGTCLLVVEFQWHAVDLFIIGEKKRQEKKCYGLREGHSPGNLDMNKLNNIPFFLCVANLFNT